MVRARLVLCLITLVALAVCLASCAGGSTEAKPPLRITTDALPAGMVGSPYSVQLQATGGRGPYTWSLVSGALPAGLAFSSTGVLSGKPTQTGNFSFTVQVVDTKTLAKARVQIQLRG